MKGKNPLSGYSWHFEYHTVDKKKEKPADCVFMTEQRICQHKKSQQYLSKCFIASVCPLRIKEKELAAKKAEQSKPIEQKEDRKKIVRISCSIPKECPVHNPIIGNDRF